MIFTFVLTLFLMSCGQTNKKSITENIEPPKVTVDTAVIAIMKIDSTNYVYPFLRDYNYPELTTNDLEKIEMIMLNFTKDYNFEQEKQYEEVKIKYPDSKFDKNQFIIDLNRYKRQYYATTNENGEKEVWINCFCYCLEKNWREELIIVLDGGNCYFNLKINLKTEKYYDVMVNGHA